MKIKFVFHVIAVTIAMTFSVAAGNIKPVFGAELINEIKIANAKCEGQEVGKEEKFAFDCALAPNGGFMFNQTFWSDEDMKPVLVPSGGWAIFEPVSIEVKDGVTAGKFEVKFSGEIFTIFSKTWMKSGKKVSIFTWGEGASAGNAGKDVSLTNQATLPGGTDPGTPAQDEVKITGFKLVAGKAVLAATGKNVGTYKVQASGDLQNWITVEHTFSFNKDGSTGFNVKDQIGGERVFFRLAK